MTKRPQHILKYILWQKFNQFFERYYIAYFCIKQISNMKYILTYVENLVNELYNIQTTTMRMHDIKKELIDIAINSKGSSIKDELNTWKECINIHISLSEKHLGYPGHPCDIAHILYLIRN